MKKIYYNKSINGEIIFWVGVLISIIVYCGFNHWIYTLVTLGQIPVIMLIICAIRRKSYYIKRENNDIIFVSKNKINSKIRREFHKIDKNEIVYYCVKDKKLYIITKNQEFTIDNFYVQIAIIKKIFD